MKKFRILKLFGLVVILTFAFVFVGLNFVQGQVKIQKGKPPHAGKQKYTWSAVILDGFGVRGVGASSPINVNGETKWGWIYDDSESNVNVGVEIRRAPYNGVDKYWTRFSFEIFYPDQIDLEFAHEGATFDNGEEGYMCIYPEGIGGPYPVDEPNSMFDFMQIEFQPHQSYEKVLFRFNTDRSVDQNVVDYEQWMGDYHDYMGFSCRILGKDPNLFKPATCEELDLFEFSSIEIGSWDHGYFERMSENVWKIVGSMEEDFVHVHDSYMICVPTQYNKKKTGVTYDSIYSASGSMDIEFEILFIRTKI